MLIAYILKTCIMLMQLFITLDFSAAMSFTNTVPSLYNVTVAACKERYLGSIFAACHQWVAFFIS